MITEDEYKQLRAKYDLYHAERNRLFPKQNCVTSEMSKLLPASPSHKEISAIEAYEFCNDKPEKYFAYIQHDKLDHYIEYHRLAYKSCRMSTWTGEFLGYGYFGRPFTSNMGDVRIPVTIHAINGLIYSGMFYYSAGDYCRVKARKDKSQ